MNKTTVLTPRVIEHKYVPGDVFQSPNATYPYTIARIEISPCGKGPAYHYQSEMEGWDFVDTLDREDSTYRLVGGPSFVEPLAVGRVLIDIAPIDSVSMENDLLTSQIVVNTPYQITSEGRLIDVSKVLDGKRLVNSYWPYLVELTDGRVATGNRNWDGETVVEAG